MQSCAFILTYWKLKRIISCDKNFEHNLNICLTFVTTDYLLFMF